MDLLWYFCDVFLIMQVAYPGPYPGISFTRGAYRSRLSRPSKTSLNLLLILTYTTYLPSYRYSDVYQLCLYQARLFLHYQIR